MLHDSSVMTVEKEAMQRPTSCRRPIFRQNVALRSSVKALNFGGNENRDLLHFNQAGTGPLFQLGKNRVNLFARLDELDLDMQMVGNFENVRGCQWRRSGAQTTASCGGREKPVSAVPVLAAGILHGDAGCARDTGHGEQHALHLRGECPAFGFLLREADGPIQQATNIANY
jgi:hypothetical protein